MSLFPAYFIGHGSPMNTIEENEFTGMWKNQISKIPKPKAVICISAHYLRKGTYLSFSDNNELLYDFFGFPEELYFTKYESYGSKKLAEYIKEEIKFTDIFLDESAKLDHGTWSVLKQIYPNPDFPVLQFGLNVLKPTNWHFELAKSLKFLREQEILILASGNIVHNLSLLNFQFMNEKLNWAIEFDNFILDEFQNKNFEKLISLDHKNSRMAVPTLDHYLPLIYLAGITDEKDKVEIFNKKTLSSISMSSVKVY